MPLGSSHVTSDSYPENHTVTFCRPSNRSGLICRLIQCWHIVVQDQLGALVIDALSYVLSFGGGWDYVIDQ